MQTRIMALLILILMLWLILTPTGKETIRRLAIGMVAKP